MTRVNLRTYKAFNQLVKKAVIKLLIWQYEVSQVEEEVDG